MSSNNLVLGITWPVAESVTGVPRTPMASRMAVFAAGALLTGWLLIGARWPAAGSVDGSRGQ